MTIRMRFGGFVVAALVALPAVAQEGWDWRVTPYVWGTSIDGEIGLGAARRDVDLEFSDILNVLSGAALMHVEAQRDDHIAFGDLAWFAVEPEDEIATIGGVAEAELDATIIELGYARASNAFGLEAGLRYWDVDLEIDPALVAGIRRGDSWVDAFAGIRNARELGRSWSMTTRANLGAGGSDLSIGLQMDFARELERGNAIVAGFRLIDLDYEEDNVRGIPVVVDLTFLGATVGFTFD
jgi:hypothetical protein